MGYPPIIIVGMHRSGTTMLSKILEQFGIFMGWRKDPNNESFFFLRFNEWILYQANASWDNPYNYIVADESFKQFISQLAYRYIGSIRRFEYLGFNKFIKYKNLKNLDFAWGWKDPRNSITLDLWIKIFPEAKILHIYRNPIDVAESLKKRATKIKNIFKWNIKKEWRFLFLKNKIHYTDSPRVLNLKEGIKLWKEYICNILKLEKNLGLKIFHIKYENLLEKPEEVLEEILDFIEIKVSKEKIKSIISEIDSSKRYSFLKNTKLLSLYDSIKNDELLKLLGYNKINF